MYYADISSSFNTKTMGAHLKCYIRMAPKHITREQLIYNCKREK